MDFDQFKEKFQKSPVEHYKHNIPKKVLVSVLVQTYNHEKYITKCLDSILEQKTDFNFEIILGEDNSNDKTREICIDYANRFPEKIRLLLHHDENKIKVKNIPTGNFNTIYNLFEAKGKFIGFCEGDDYWDDTSKLQIQIHWLLNFPNYVLAYHRYDFINQIGETIDPPGNFEQPSKTIKKDKLIKNIEHPLFQTICFKNVFDEIPEEVLKVINLDTFILSLLGHYGKGKFLNNINPSKYRIQSGGIWSSKLRKEQLIIKIHTYSQLDKYYKINNIEISKYYKKLVLNHKKMILINHLKSGHFFSAIKTTKDLLSKK